jgi:hypothetical protein
MPKPITETEILRLLQRLTDAVERDLPEAEDAELQEALEEGKRLWVEILASISAREAVQRIWRAPNHELRLILFAQLVGATPEITAVNEELERRLNPC